MEFATLFLMESLLISGKKQVFKMTALKVYEYINATNSNEKGGLYAPPARSELSKLIVKTIHHLGSYTNQWPRAEVFVDPHTEHFPLTDFPIWVQYATVPIFSARAKEVFSPILKSEVEWLPLYLAGEQQYFVVPCREPIEAVEIQKCELKHYSSTGKIMAIKKFAFVQELVKRHPFFKLPFEWTGRYYFTDEFRRIVEANGLTGLSFDYPVEEIDAGDDENANGEKNYNHGVTQQTVLCNFTPMNITDPKETLAAWLAHPQEFGCHPQSMQLLRSYDMELTNSGVRHIDLIEYVMPDGNRGRGLVGPIAWSFMGDAVNVIPDDDYVLAYCGWLFLFPALQDGRALSRFDPVEETDYLASKQAEGFTEICVTERYKIGTSELFEWRGSYAGEAVRGAGNIGNDIVFQASSPCFHLPAIYFLLGQMMTT